MCRRKPEKLLLDAVCLLFMLLCFGSKVMALLQVSSMVSLVFAVLHVALTEIERPTNGHTDLQDHRLTTSNTISSVNDANVTTGFPAIRNSSIVSGDEISSTSSFNSVEIKIHWTTNDSELSSTEETTFSSTEYSTTFSTSEDHSPSNTEESSSPTTDDTTTFSSTEQSTTSATEDTTTTTHLTTMGSSYSYSKYTFSSTTNVQESASASPLNKTAVNDGIGNDTSQTASSTVQLRADNTTSSSDKQAIITLSNALNVLEMNETTGQSTISPNSSKPSNGSTKKPRKSKQLDQPQLRNDKPNSSLNSKNVSRSIKKQKTIERMNQSATSSQPTKLDTPEQNAIVSTTTIHTGTDDIFSQTNQLTITEGNSSLMVELSNRTMTSSVFVSVTEMPTEQPDVKQREKVRNFTKCEKIYTASQSTIYYPDNHTGGCKPPTIQSSTSTPLTTTHSNGRSVSTQQGEEIMSVGSMALVVTLAIVILAICSMIVGFAIYKYRSGGLFDDSISLMANRNGQRKTFYYDTTI